MPFVTALVVAAGASARMGAPKAWIPLAGKPAIAHALCALQAAARVDAIVIAARAEDVEALERLCREEGIDKLARVVAGGDTRGASVRRALDAVPEGTTYIAIHDGARALVSPADVDRVIAAALDSGAATAAHPVYDTVKKISANMRGAEILDTETGNIDAAANSAAAGDTLTGKPVTVERDGLWAVQTPQVFELARYRAAINDNYEDATDDCQLFERRSWPVTLVHTSAYNIKLTTPEDVVATRALLGGGGIRVGHGYDAHRLVTGRRLILGGVDIPFDKGLLGHSDADVLLHAVMDALLGAAGLGDIGGRFPDTDEAYRDADSLGLLRTVIEELPLQVGNIDATVVCQAPKLAPYMDQMRGNIARACGTSPARVNVKATTEEGMGFTGTGEGIAAHAVVMLYGE